MALGVRKVVCAASILIVSAMAGANATPARLVDSIAALAPPRMLRARLSVNTAYLPCIATAGAGRGEGIACAARKGDSPRLDAIAARAAAAAHRSPSADALHAAGVADLLAAAEGGRRLDQAIESFRDAARIAERPAPVLADLAAALLFRAERTGTARDIVEAIEVSEEAAELEPRNQAVLFTRALAMEQWGLVDQAAEAWRRCQQAGAGTRWAREAEQHAAALASRGAPPTRPRDFSPRSVRDFVATWPQQARELGWNHLLGDWGAAVAGGDSARADTALREAELLGHALRERGRDATLASAVREIRGVRGSVATRELALAHREYAAGMDAFARLDYRAFRDSLTAAAGRRHGSRTLSLWTESSLGSALLLNGDYDGGKRILSALLARPDTAAFPAITGRAWWGMGAAQLRQGVHQEALEAARRGSALLTRSGDDELGGGSAYVAADAAFSLGATLDAYDEARSALALLRRYPGSVWRLNVLSSSARIASADGLARAAERIQEERLAVARRMGPARVAEVQAARAQAFAAAGDTARARRAAAAGQSLVDSLPPGIVRNWVTAELQLTRGRLQLAGHAAGSVAVFDSVLSATVTPITVFRVLQALGARAQARLERGDVAGAIADLDTAAAQIEREHRTVIKASYRASLIDAATGVFNRVALLRLARGDTSGALLSLDRGRALLTPGTRRLPAVPWRPRMAPGVVGVEYALIGDTLLAWTVSGSRVRLSRTLVNRDSLTRVGDRARIALQRRDPEPVVRRDLARLHRWLVRPIAARLGSTGTRLLVVADGDIPLDLFATLFDAATGRYVIADHALTFAPALRGGAEEAAPHPVPSRVLVMSDPAFDPNVYQGVERLPEARLEGDSVAMAYQAAFRLDGGAATAAALFEALPRVEVVHLAAHARFDDERPDRSYVVLAPGPDAAGHHAPLTADSLAHARWSGVRLVVLSACETLRSRRGRSGGFAGLAGSLLASGAGGVVGASWPVEDRASRRLMIEFHRAYRRSGDGAQALRTAQLRLLQSPDPALRSPSAWAAFRYAGN